MPPPPAAPHQSEFITAGDVRVRRAPAELTTVLGSCVTVCLWAGEAGLGGLNHFLLPRGEPGELSYRGGERACAALVERMLGAGASRRRMEAKVFGGAASGRFHWNAGAENVLVAWEALARERIPIVASDVGGTRGRHLSFDVGTGIVQVRYLEDPLARLKGGAA